MIIKHFPIELELANCYLLVDEDTRDALLVDAGEFRSELSDYVAAHGLNVRAIFVTHPHHDHNGAVDEYARIFGVDLIYGGSGRCAGRRTRVVNDGKTVSAGSITGVALSVPGHMPDLLCLQVPTARAVFTGDSLFAGSVGGTSSAEAREQQLTAIREKLLSLPDEVIVYSGHGPATTIGIERRFNAFLT
jgi:hydroxyacylglutathione hydrolase